MVNRYGAKGPPDWTLRTRVAARPGRQITDSGAPRQTFELSQIAAYVRGRGGVANVVMRRVGGERAGHRADVMKKRSAAAVVLPASEAQQAFTWQFPKTVIEETLDRGRVACLDDG
jgi:hypothetical protein